MADNMKNFHRIFGIQLGLSGGSHIFLLWHVMGLNYQR